MNNSAQNEKQAMLDDIASMLKTFAKGESYPHLAEDTG
jgi:hypothetical protein